MNPHWSAYTVSPLTADTSPSLVLTFSNKWYLFHCGEGTTRALTASGVPFKRISAIFCSGADFASAGGLPGNELSSAAQ